MSLGETNIDSVESRMPIPNHTNSPTRRQAFIKSLLATKGDVCLGCPQIFWTTGVTCGLFVLEIRPLKQLKTKHSWTTGNQVKTPPPCPHPDTLRCPVDVHGEKRACIILFWLVDFKGIRTLPRKKKGNDNWAPLLGCFAQLISG